MIDSQNDSRKASGNAAEPGSFRARLMARQAARPQSTLAIDSGIFYRPGASSTPESRRAADAVRDEARRRRANAEAAAKAEAVAKAEAERIRAATAVEVPAPAVQAPPSDEELVSVIEDIAARKEEERRAPAPAIVSSAAAATARPEVRPQVAEREEHEDVSTRLGDVSQLAFAGLAVLGLAGLSVLAAQNALKSKDKAVEPATGTSETGALAPALKPGGASAVALASAAEPEAPKAWFNYQGVADMLADRKAEMETEAKLAQEAAEKEARLRAAKAIADAEAVRVAEAEAAAAAAAEQARLAEEAERQRLAEAEAARVAQVEADRLARLEAQRQAAAEAEAQRLADLEAKRVAEAEAETQRLANLDAQRLAKLRADREAAEAAARQEAFELAKSQEAERLRLAALKAQAEADAAEARRLEQIAAKAAADRLAAEKLLAEQQARQANLQTISAPAIAPAPAPASPKPAVAEAPAPQPIVFTAYEGPVPVPASHKPAKPAQLIRASYTPDEGKTVTRKAPAAMSAGKADVRDFAETSGLQTPEAFLAGRVERTSAEPVLTEDMDLVRQAFRSILDNGADGSKQAIITPDGRTLTIVLERTVSREMGQSTVRTVTFTPGVSKVTRVVTEQAPVTVSVMCRDVAYAFAGQERGRFAACQAPEGGWTLARATDVVKVTTASLPNSAS
ncbi:hypothetical protein [Hyphomonas jannaschiana]|uniref:Uncharacterized protein n=1 Tax=Hyphomonas jannaschiana VP2 TaxID=1280952 RepID=A0A059FDS2_9PROT|nr:hypothetical protein [Hyphomonas jannaschiana]KCZ88691.1 hypothetical protein HJA_09989 [Hyphomonas jannaschiana VP2]